MKGSNSRFSHRPDRRYSNTAHIQGGMVTDADLTETGQLHQARDEGQNRLAMGTGVPGVDGIVAFRAGVPELAEGWVIAEGKQGRFARGSDDDNAGMALFTDQADLPGGPGLPDGQALIYADLWERPIFAAEDTYLTDAGLHGAETSYRTRTMVQVKALPLSAGLTLADARAELANGKGAFRRTGEAVVSVTPKNTQIAVDDCDPCADQIDIVPVVPNALFRLEVVEVRRNSAGKPTHARFAWSLENAAAIETMARLKDPKTGEATKDAFARDGAVYEYLTDEAEAQKGWFGPGFVPVAPVFKDMLGEDPATHVRRWDGAAEVNLGASTVTAASNIGTGKLTVAAGKATLALDAFTVTIVFEDREMLAGDYWLVELRRFAPESERVRLIGGKNNKDARPAGIEHYFCALFTTLDKVGEKPGDAERRRLSFPALNDIPASHVSFGPDCPPLFDNAENVADALNALCDLNATEVHFEPPAECERFKDAKTVHEALVRLCNVQDDTVLTRVFRVMMDWGVICGIRPRLAGARGTKITWSAGTMLDRSGRLIDVKAGAFDLVDLSPENISGPLNEILQKDGEICLSFSADADGSLKIHLTDRATAFGPVDRTFGEAVEACINGRKLIDFGKIARPLKVAEKATVKKIADVWANRKALEGKVPLSLDEGETAKAVNKTLAKEYLDNAEPERADEVKRLLDLAEAKIQPNAVSGDARNVVRMQLEATKFGIIAAAEEEDRTACRCANGLTPCPPGAAAKALLVPVACLKMLRATPEVSDFTEMCVYCCRKQAMTWRSYRYYQGSFTDRYLAGLKEECCRPVKDPETDFGGFLDDWIHDIYRPVPIPLPKPVPDPDPIWPPITKGPIGIDPLGPLINPGPLGPLINVKPNIDRLDPKEAEKVLTGNGFDLVDRIELDDVDDPLAKLGELGAKGDRVLGRDTPEPGDKVVMISRGGKAVDFVVVEKGSGKLPFETEADTEERVKKIIKNLDLKVGGAAGSGVLPVAELEGLEGRLKALDTERNATEADIGKLARLRETLANEVGGLEVKLGELTSRRANIANDIDASRRELAEIEGLNTATRTSISAEVAKSRAELNEIEALKTARQREIAAAKDELAGIEREHTRFLEKMRTEQPIEALLGGNQPAIEALRRTGVVTVGDINSTNTNKLTSALSNTGLNGSQVKSLVATFLRR